MTAIDAEIRAAWAAAHVTPLWEDEAAHGGVKRAAASHVWAWQTMEPLIRQALGVASTEIVERRVLTLRNPQPRFVGDRASVGNITAALQILKPGESARPHRHTMNAIRFVLSGSGASTVVDGKECPMEEGDLITTPAWTWHEHVHHGDAPVVWLDALDVPLHAFMGTGVFEPGPMHDPAPVVADDAFTHASLVPEGVDGAAAYSPVFRHRWADVARALGAAPRGRDGARRVRYVNPMTGGPVLAMLDCFAVELDADGTRPWRSSANAVCVVMEGHGRSRVGDDTIAWRERDVFSLPAGSWVSHSAAGSARLFMVTDRDVLRRLDLLRDEYQDNQGRTAP